jgi:hypothetical protein
MLRQEPANSTSASYQCINSRHDSRDSSQQMGPCRCFVQTLVVLGHPLRAPFRPHSCSDFALDNRAFISNSPKYIKIHEHMYFWIRRMEVLGMLLSLDAAWPRAMFYPLPQNVRNCLSVPLSKRELCSSSPAQVMRQNRFAIWRIRNVQNWNKEQN